MSEEIKVYVNGEEWQGGYSIDIHTQPREMRIDLVGEQPEPEHLERKQRRNRDDKYDERRGRRQFSDDAGEPGLDRPQWQPGNDALDDRLKVTPQPRLDQKDDRDQDQKSSGYAAHGGNLGISAAGDKAPFGSRRLSRRFKPPGPKTRRYI